ncbi:MAG: hypothetical protein ACRCVJ_11460 [Clostridium sp.]|uniref:hypothetical protein n=1 Tax=Clostridium sp. TaxID=1506 RepID=UPI003F3AEBE5
MHKVSKQKSYSIGVIVILLISLSVNVLICLKNKQYSHRIGVNSYKNIEIIKLKNDKNLEIINKSIESYKISNEELLTLYTNYSDMADSVVELWDDYSFYKESDKDIFKNKKIDTSTALDNDIYTRIENYLGNTLMNIMSTDSDDLKIDGKDLEDFKVMESLASNMSKIFKALDDKALSDVENSDKEKAVVNNKYWVDVLREINKVSGKYIDYDFTKDVKKVTTIM